MYQNLMNGSYGQPQQSMMPSSQPMVNPTAQSIMGTPGMPSYAHGGKVKKASLTLAHMSPHELNFLDHLQGGVERHNKSGIRSYTHLEEVLKNPHIKANVHHHAHQHHAAGGDANTSHAEVEHMAHMGRGGDTEMALIGPNTHHLFNQWAGHSTRNPHDGHPEYFSLSGLFGGMGNAIKGFFSNPKTLATMGTMGQAALPALSNIATQHLGNKYGDIGTSIGQMGSNLAGKTFDRMGADSGANPLGSAIGQGFGNFANAKNRGESTQNALGSGLVNTGRNMGQNTTMGGMLSGMGKNIQGGMGAKDILKNAAPQAFAGLRNAGTQAMQAHNSGQNFGQSMRAGLNTLNPRAEQEQEYTPEPLFG